MRSRKDVDYDDLASVRGAPAPANVLLPSKPGAPAANLRKNQLTVARALAGLEAQGLANGVVVGAMSSKHSSTFLDHDNRHARTFTVEPYSIDEMVAVQQDYVATGVSLEQLTPFETDYVSAITARRPREVLAYAQLL